MAKLDYVKWSDLEIKLDKPTVINVVLSTSGWSGSGPFTQSASVPGHTVNKVSECSISSLASFLEREEINRCGLAPTGEATNSITFQAQVRPTLDFNITIRTGDRA